MADGAMDATEGRAAGPLGVPPAANPRLRPLYAFLVGVVIAGILAVVLFVGIGTGPGKGPGGLASVGTAAPDFSLPRLGGGAPVDLDELGVDRHRPIVLNFFESACSPCLTEAPLLAAAAQVERTRGSDVQFVGVDVLTSSTAGLAFVRSEGITYPVGEDPALRVASVRYGLVGPPLTVFVDASGRIVARQLGPLTSSDLRHDLALLTPSGR